MFSKTDEVAADSWITENLPDSLPETLKFNSILDSWLPASAEKKSSKF